MPCFPDMQNNRIIYFTLDTNKGYASFIPTVDEGENMILLERMLSSNSKLMSATTTNKSISELQMYFAYFSLYILFPLLYNMLVSGDKSIIIMLWRYISSGVFDTVKHVKDVATDIFYAALRLFGKYNFSTYTVVKDGREIYSASSLFYYYKSDVYSVYRIDRAKYNVCKWIDKQCLLFSKIHGVEPEVNETHNNIYDFILHKVDNQPYIRIHRGNFTGRTHTLITQHYRPYKNLYQIAPDAELVVHVNESTVEPPIVSNATCSSITSDSNASGERELDTCFQPFKFTINMMSPNNFFLEKNEFLDAKFLQWKLYNDFGRDGIAKYIRSPLYDYKVNMYYNESMKDYFRDVITTSAAATKLAAHSAPDVLNSQKTQLHAYQLDHNQSVMVGHTYIVKVDSLLRCPVFESNEKQVFDIDGVLSTYYDCSDSDDNTVTTYDTDDDNDDNDDTGDNEDNGDDAAGGAETNNADETSKAHPVTVPDTADDQEFEMIQEQ